MTTRILVTPDFKAASAPTSAGEVAHHPSTAAACTSPQRTAPSFPWTFWTWLAARFMAASRAASSLRTSLLNAMKDELQVSVADRRRGYLKGLCCSICRLEAHDEGEMCPEQRSGTCVICGFVLIDRFGNCPLPGAYRRGHAITERHPTTAAEWRRAHFAVLTPEPFRRNHQQKGSR